ncbi:MAG: serine hydrolase, partial [Bacteroidota bacterium]
IFCPMMRTALLLMFLYHLALSSSFAQNISLHELLEAHRDSFPKVMAQPEKYEIQIIYTQINRDQNNIPSFKTYRYRVNRNRYFYPASTVKMPIAFLALEKINQLNIRGLDKHTVMKTDALRSPQQPAHHDTTAANQLPSIAQYIKKIFLVSDNDAFNRLYEFLNVRNINHSLWNKGYRDLHILHRLGAEGAVFGLEDNRYTNSIRFIEEDSLVYFQGESYSKIDPRPRLNNRFKGKGHYNRTGQLVQLPFDFSYKNYVSLSNLHDMLKAVLFPKSISPHQRFDLTAADYDFLYRYLSAKPRESDAPRYDKPDGYVKFFLYGGAAEKIPDHIRIFNKVGFAYGFLSDVAYIMDLENKVEFMLSAVIHVNENEIYNDNQYEYDRIGLPFLAKLGQIIYDYEKQRPKAHLPDFSRFEKAVFK